MAQWIVYDTSTFEVVSGGSGSGSEIPRQPAGRAALPVSPQVLRISWAPEEGPIDIAALKSDLCDKLDREAGAFRIRFITDVPGQAQTYEKKEAEARLWAINGAGDEVTNPDRYPFIIAEATVRSMTFADVQAEIMAQVSLLTPLAALIEAHRVNAKQAVLSGTTLPEIIGASLVDWEGLLP